MEEDDPTAEKDDLQVAWEALETAKVLYQRTAETDAPTLAGTHATREHHMRVIHFTSIDDDDDDTCAMQNVSTLCHTFCQRMRALQHCC